MLPQLLLAARRPGHRTRRPKFIGRRSWSEFSERPIMARNGCAGLSPNISVVGGQPAAPGVVPDLLSLTQIRPPPTPGAADTSNGQHHLFARHHRSEFDPGPREGAPTLGSFKVGGWRCRRTWWCRHWA